MKAATAIALASAVLLASPALAQAGDPPPSGDLVMRPLGGLVPMPPTSGPMAHGSRMLGLTEPRDAPPPPPPSSNAAEFSFRRGPTEIRVRCSDKEPVKVCADAAVMLMDKFATVTAGAPEASSPPGEAAPAK